MKAKFMIAVATCLALLLSACGATAQSLIVGTWEVENAPMKMVAEFGGDGTAKITMLGQTVRGTYKLEGGNELTWMVNGITTKAKVDVTANELELTDDQNRTIKYRRK
ncbi:MAG TPA: hypothetical protein VMT15_06485 [Bryobacteraceae bacterium]|nr:hypothetical protein [Bryobacteraceae bacterium]